MKNPRIIIADENIEYVIPLQRQIIEELYDKVDIEIITDSNYFGELFSTPQEGEVLLIAESLYNSEMLRHNIKNVFILTEQYDEGFTATDRVTKIFKYSSIKEILKEVIGKTSKDLNVNIGNVTEPQIILVYSATGGVGKTTIALGMAANLTKSYKKVLYINASWLHTFQYYLNNKSPISSNDVYSELMTPGGDLFEKIKFSFRNETFTYMPPFKASLISLSIKYDIYEKIAIQAKQSGEYDYIIIDVETEFNDQKAGIMNISDKVVVVTKQTPQSVFATNTFISNVGGIKDDKYLFICNDFDESSNNALLSPASSPDYSIKEYVEHISNYEGLSIDELSDDKGIKKTSYLIM